MKKATSQDVAKLAGVSQATVSLILNGSTKISFSNETRERVLAAAEKLDYKLPHHNTSAADSFHKSTHLLAVLTPMLTNQYYTEMVRLLEEYGEAKNYRVILSNTFSKPDLEQYYLETCLANHVDGIIYTFLPSFPHQVEQINKTTPVVIIGEKTSSLSITSIELSNITAGSMLIQYLYQLGHRHFAFLSSPFSHMTQTREERLDGIRSQIKEYGLPASSLDVFVSESGPEEEEDSIDGRPFNFIVGHDMTEKLLDSDSQATAIIGVNDMTAIGSIHALQEHGYRVPKDFSVCGFDNVFSSVISSPKLTTIDHHMPIRCQSAIDMIISMSSSKGSTLSQVNKIEYTPQVIVRESTGPVRSSERLKK